MIQFQNINRELNAFATYLFDFRYDYLQDGRSPGDKYNAYAQCQLAFGNTFKPHYKEEPPFEVHFFLIFLDYCEPWVELSKQGASWPDA